MCESSLQYEAICGVGRFAGNTEVLSKANGQPPSSSHIAGSKADYESAVNLISEWSNLLGVDVPSNLSSLVFDAGSPESVHHLTGEWHNTNGHPLGLPRFWTDTYSVYLNYPINSSLTLGPAPTKEEPHPKPRFVAALKEDLLKEDPTSGRGIPPFHGYSISGTAEGQVVYAALGTKQDFDRLAELNISVAGKVALVRYGGPFRGLKVRAAQEAGAVACLIYSDPHEDPVKAADGYKMYPDGPAREPSSVQRGSVQALSFYPGDPSTPGKPSYRNASRLPIDEADSLPKIPSLPISYADALPLLNSLKGKGIRARDVGDDWEGEVPGVDEYWTGPSEDVAHVEN